MSRKLYRSARADARRLVKVGRSTSVRVSQHSSSAVARVQPWHIMIGMAKLTRLKDVRQRKGLTQQQLAEKAGVNGVTIARIEGAKDEPFPTTVRKVAAALGVEPEELLAPPRHELPNARA